MQQLTGMDAGFLYMETARSFGHVASLSVYARPDDPTFEPFEAFRSQLEARLHLIEPFRRRLVEVPLGLDRPYWIIDPDFDLDFHVRHLGLPAPGSTEQLSDQVARIIGRPLDRTRPLWEAYVIEGLEGGDFGILTKVHHATIDGASGVELLSIMLDTEPDAAPATAADQAGAVALLSEAVPPSTELLRRAAVNMVVSPGRAARLGLRALGEVATASRNIELAGVLDAVRRRLPRSRSDTRDRPPILPLKAAPRTPWNASITAHRRLALRSVPLDDVKTIKNHLDATVNDVVMAVCAGALRRYLQAADALPAEPLVAMVPVSIRSGDEADIWTNRVSGLVADLPTHIDDPVQRVRAVHQTMEQAKQQFDLMPADLIADLTQFAMPALATRAIRMAAATRIADRLNPPVNLIISNVPGPRQPLYLAGATMKHFYPVSTVIDGQGLNITVQSYLGTLDFGLVSCRELVPDLENLVDLCVDEVGRLLAACTSTTKPAQRKRDAEKRGAKRSAR
jgi:diacylglycerol O-acyltransferase / wax synthase